MFKHYKTDSNKMLTDRMEKSNLYKNLVYNKAVQKLMGVWLCMFMQTCLFNLISLSILLNSDLSNLLKQLFLPGNGEILKYSRLVGGKKTVGLLNHIQSAAAGRRRRAHFQIEIAHG